MNARINGIAFPIEPNPEIDSIKVSVVIGDTEGWRSEIQFTLDSGANILTMPRSIWLKIFKEIPSSNSLTTAETADGRNANVVRTEVSLRIETTDHQRIEIHRVPCAILDGGTESLLPLPLLSLFRMTITQGKLVELVLCPKRKSELARLSE